MEAGTTQAGTAVYMLILVPVHFVCCPLSHPSPECNTVDEQYFIKQAQYVCSSPSSPPCCHRVCLCSLSPLQTTVSGSFCPSTHFSSCRGSQPRTQEPAAGRRVGLPPEVMRVTSAATTTTSLTGMVSTGCRAHAPRSAHGCLYSRGNRLISAVLGKAAF